VPTTTVEPESSWGDIIRAIVGFISTGVILALLSEPPIRSWGVLVICFAIAVICIVTARNRRGVVYGIIAILASRLLMGLVLGLLRHYRVPHG
jgi:hypothetical protein